MEVVLIILIVLLVLSAAGGAWGHKKWGPYGYSPAGLLMLVFVIVLIVYLVRRV
ncbi:MAG: DUF3309 family protein [Planctomycetes bacterium]|nr:DUF3309 family protein [Planctomycetota bacterium]